MQDALNTNRLSSIQLAASCSHIHSLMVVDDIFVCDREYNNEDANTIARIIN